MDPRSMGKLRFAFSVHEEGVAVLVTRDEVVPAHEVFLRAKPTPVPLIL